MSKHRPITQEEFDILLDSVLKGIKANTLLTIPGIYEILSEEYNNTVLQIWEGGTDNGR